MENKTEDQPIFKGSFSFTDGELDFTCTTKGFDFPTVKAGLIKLRDEINRQLEHQANCPYYQQ